MTSWTAEVEWHEDPSGGMHHRLLAIQEQDWGSFHVDSATGTVTATVTMQAPDLLRALDAVLLLVSGLTGQEVTVKRITSSSLALLGVQVTPACDRRQVGWTSSH